MTRVSACHGHYVKGTGRRMAYKEGGGGQTYNATFGRNMRWMWTYVLNLKDDDGKGSSSSMALMFDDAIIFVLTEDGRLEYKYDSYYDVVLFCMLTDVLRVFGIEVRSPVLLSGTNLTSMLYVSGQHIREALACHDTRHGPRAQLALRSFCSAMHARTRPLFVRAGSPLAEEIEREEKTKKKNKEEVSMQQQRILQVPPAFVF